MVVPLCEIYHAKGVGYGTAALIRNELLQHSICQQISGYIGPIINRGSSSPASTITGLAFLVASPPQTTHILCCSKDRVCKARYIGVANATIQNEILTFDHTRKIRYVIAGWPGSVHDTKA